MRKGNDYLRVVTGRATKLHITSLVPSDKLPRCSGSRSSYPVMPLRVVRLVLCASIITTHYVEFYVDFALICRVKARQCKRLKVIIDIDARASRREGLVTHRC